MIKQMTMDVMVYFLSPNFVNVPGWFVVIVVFNLKFHVISLFIFEVVVVLCYRHAN